MFLENHLIDLGKNLLLHFEQKSAIYCVVLFCNLGYCKPHYYQQIFNSIYMKNSCIRFYIQLLVVFSLLSSCIQKNISTVQEKSYTQFVDPFIGTGGHGHVFLGANVPFGMVQLGPSQIMEGWDWCSGYHYSSNNIMGFTHTHLSGTGIGDLNDILIMPTVGKLDVTKASKEKPDKGYVSTFSHANEKCEPGYYSVLLDKYKIKAELTATERVGMHRYQFEKNDTARLLFDMSFGMGWDRATDASVEKINDSTITGYRFSNGWAEDQKVFFTAVFSQPIQAIQYYIKDSLQNAPKGSGNTLKAAIEFNVKQNSPLLVKVALSPVSTNNAALNMKEELPGWDFNAVAQQAKNKWNKELSKIEIEANDDTKKVFYTAMYHSLFAPVLFNDVNKDYLGADKKIYHNARFNNYSVFSLWDTYRALHPLFTITQPDKVNDIINTFLHIYQQQGRLPIWHLMGNETDCMNGDHSIPVIVDAFFKGYKNYDTLLAYEAVKITAMRKDPIPWGDPRVVPKQDLRIQAQYLNNLSFIPADTLEKTVSNALEFAIDDWCVAQMAKAFNKKDDYDYFTKRSNLYKMYFDSITQFMRGRNANNTWRTPFDPAYSSHLAFDYVEGNAWQYTWLVPHDPKGLIGLFGSDDAFTKKLDQLFTTSASMGEEASPDISGLIGMYAQGNEPNHHIPYLYAFAGEQWKTAWRVRQIVDTFYTSKTDGLCGNEDCGQMSAWYIFSAAGFYPVNPANGIYILGSPAVNEATFHLPNNKKFTIKAINNSNENVYIQSASFNGKPYTKSWFTHAMLMNGGALLLTMGNKPSDFGKEDKDRPK